MLAIWIDIEETTIGYQNLLTQLFKRYGIPQVIITDRRRTFEVQIVQEQYGRSAKCKRNWTYNKRAIQRQNQMLKDHFEHCKDE
ncbi:hypothetical protein NPA07_02440 [Mycoplasmopsis caviae]|uniref:Integrase catalytic domain-containing protein n=1 Tax=Mycoplasmopsis caviae TaxID=55603 RepID=A0ABY5IZY5_9BACT|nr:hypothetical protein [Mycoplasmopsis caviae]UUD35710.1 hypothetical protein NPA07_02440 [Mycoplasmopsis caviae]